MPQPVNTPATDQGPMQLDLHQVLKSKLGKKHRFVPKWLVRWLERVICVDDLNGILRAVYPKRGAEFCDAALAEMHATAELAPGHNWPEASNGRLIIVSNHPMGGLEGLAIISLLTRHYGEGVKVIVNDILSAVEPLSDIFLPINKHGAQSRANSDEIAKAMEGDKPIVVFPAGLVSRLDDQRQIRDKQWHKMFVTKAIQHHRDVLPIYFSGQLSDKFYRFARRRERLGIKLNIEMVYLPREMVRGTCRDFRVKVGQVIPWQQLAQTSSHYDQAQAVRQTVYDLGENT